MRLVDRLRFGQQAIIDWAVMSVRFPKCVYKYTSLNLDPKMPNRSFVRLDKWQKCFGQFLRVKFRYIGIYADRFANSDVGISGK
jgi:hypothetical protein